MKQERSFGKVETGGNRDKIELINNIVGQLENNGYTIVEINNEKPWGGYIRIDNSQADSFVEDFFLGTTANEARLGKDIELSPKILIVSPEQRLSWQYHNRRSEKWIFLTNGSYSKSQTDEEGSPIETTVGDIIQFETGERHRLNGIPGEYCLVGEIWQHTDPDNPSDENDIVRLADDYSRA
jgi:hypothetical protein